MPWAALWLRPPRRRLSTMCLSRRRLSIMCLSRRCLPPRRVRHARQLAAVPLLVPLQSVVRVKGRVRGSG